MTERQAGEKLQQIILELGFSLGLKLFSLDSDQTRDQSSIMFCFQGCLRGKGLSWRLQFKLFWFVSNGHLLCESSPIYKKYIILDWFKSCLQLQNFESSFQGKGWRFSGVGGAAVQLWCWPGRRSTYFAPYLPPHHIFHPFSRHFYCHIFMAAWPRLMHGPWMCPLTYSHPQMLSWIKLENVEKNYVTLQMKIICFVESDALACLLCFSLARK